MLQRLYIRNFIIISELEINFERGLSVLTGETGAGKSILLGALSLLLGERADSSFILDKNQKTILEAQFSVNSNSSILELLKGLDIEDSTELLLRREFSAASKARIFINDTPASLQALQTLAEGLIDMHRQFDTVELKNVYQQIKLYDTIIGANGLQDEMSRAFKLYKQIEKELSVVQEKNAQLRKELDYTQFLFQEIESLKLTPNESLELEKSLSLLLQSESIKAAYQKAIVLLEQSDAPILSQLKTTIQNLENQAGIVSTQNDLIQRLQSAYIELKEALHDIESLYDATNHDEALIHELSERINEINKLCKKHHVNSSDALMELQEELQTSINKVQHSDEEEQALQKKLDSTFKEATTIAKKLSKNRLEHVDEFQGAVNTMLKDIGMPKAEFKVQLDTEALSEYGYEKVHFILDANKTNNFKPLYKAASGGELSRIMLAIKSLLAKNISIPTLIFDEIDTGISGETAIQVARLLKKLSTNHQIISITHLPQIAGKAEHHYHIYKEESQQGDVRTYVKLLNENERVDTLAEMIHGKSSNEKSKQMAKELLTQA